MSSPRDADGSIWQSEKLGARESVPVEEKVPQELLRVELVETFGFRLMAE